ncbi:MAG TPA: ATP-binding cassette domain-containing protein [Anaeromyxobacter sp.]|nr:ATP-binding cassette domain-containing protein [Anaeromyxobacter sp.]
MTPLLELREVRKHFHLGHGKVVRAVDGVSLTIGEREAVGLVGESGCGKSTLARTVVGLHPPTGGSILFRGEPLPVRYRAGDFRRLGRKIQMIFQDPYSSLDPRMTVREIVTEGPLIHGLWRRAEAVSRAALLLGRVGLSPDDMSRFPHEFSGGQRQRIGIARALALEPEVLVCDEPISALDVSVQAQVVNLLARLRRSMGLTILFIAHDLSMVRYVSDRIAVMDRGRIVELGPADDVYFRPKHPYTRALVAANPALELVRTLRRPIPALSVQGPVAREPDERGSALDRPYPPPPPDA